MLVPGVSDDSSIENSIDSTAALSSLALLGNLYSTLPRPNQISAAWTRAGSRKEFGNVEQADHAIRRAQPARRADLDGSEQAERHRHFDHIGVAPRFVRLEPHDDLVETGRADFLVALLGLDRLGRDQPRLFQHLHVDCDGRLRQAELVADVVDVEPALAAQQLEDADADRRRQSLENADVLFRIDGKEVGFHDSCDVPRPAKRSVYIRIPDSPATAAACLFVADRQPLMPADKVIAWVTRRWKIR